MKRIISIALAVCISLLSSLTLSCGTIDAPNDDSAKLYYLYNAELDVFDKTEYLEVDGNNCSLVKNNDGITVTSSGAITFSGSGFTITCTSELLGVTITNVMSGVRESDGVLRVDSQTVIGMTATPATEYEVMYYCLDGVKPESPIVQYTITFDGNGGKFDGDEQKTVRTSLSGTVSLPDAPTRSGYDFIGFYKEKTGGNAAVTNTTVFDRSMTVYAWWEKRSSSAQRYYYYDGKNDKLDENDYIDIDGTDVTMVVINGGTTVRNSGTIVYNENSFTITVVKTLTLRGAREDNGALRITSVTMISDGTEIEDTTVSYYCPKGVKPPAPPTPPVQEDGVYEIAFNVAPGMFADGTQSRVLKTDKSGKITLPDSPTRNGYKFKGFKSAATGKYITADTVFTCNTWVYAEFINVFKVEFVVEGETVETREVEAGEPLGDYDTPLVLEQDYDKYHMFKGWYEKDRTKHYSPLTRITKNVTLVAEYYTHSNAEYYRNAMWKWSEPGHLYIHYLRKDGEVYSADSLISTDMSYTAYEDWLLWAWPKDGDGRAFEPIRKGMYGIVYDIDMKKTYTDGGWNVLTLTHENKTVNYFGKDLGIMFFDDKSRQSEVYWKNDGGNLRLEKSLVFDYTDYGSGSNSTGVTKYLFDENVSVHLCFMREYISQKVIDNHQLMMFVYHHDSHAIWG